VALVDERKWKDRAHALVREGKLPQAIELYVKLITQNRTDPALRLRHAELCARVQRLDAAVASYRAAAHLLGTAGHHAKAHAALTCAVRLMPGDLGIRRALKELAAEREAVEGQVPQKEPSRGATVEIAAVTLDADLGDEQEAPTEVFIPAWA
jgi:hypothetical protein